MRQLSHYMTRNDIARVFGRKREWVRKFVKGLKESGRYPPDQVIEDGYLILVHEDVVMDWIRVRGKLGKELIAPYEETYRNK